MEEQNQAMQGVQEHAVGFFDKMKAWFSHFDIAATFQEYKYTLVEMGIYFGVGVVFGVIIKKYLKYILLLILFIVSLIILEQFDLIGISVNWAKIQELFSIKPAAPEMTATVVEAYWQWVKANAWIVLSASLGFIAGLKVG